MKTVVVLIVLSAAMLWTTCVQAAESQRVAIDRKWKAVEQWKGQTENRFRAIERDLGRSSRTPAETDTDANSAPRNRSKSKR